MVKYAFITNSGSREYNEDTIIALSDKKTECFALADGLGGHGHGKEASEKVTSVVRRSFLTKFNKKDIKAFIRYTFEKGQEEITKAQEEMGLKNSMKSTLVVGVISKQRLNFGHIGDSRLYLFGKKKLIKRTIDHSVVQMLVKAGEIEEKDIRFHPDRNKLLSVMGTEWEKPRYEIEEKTYRINGKQVLICSDGFWELINEEEMIKCLKTSKNVVQWANSMRSIVEKNGEGKDADNFSAICIWG